MSGNTVSVGGSSPHVYHAIDSTMGPKMDLSIPSFTATSPAGASYVRGDIVTLDATVANSGDLEYNSGGSVDFYYVINGNKNYIGQGTPINTLTTSGASRTMTAQTTFDTLFPPIDGRPSSVLNSLPPVRALPQTIKQQLELDHDRPPKSKTPQVIGTSDINRGQYFSVLAKGDADDNVDNVDTMSFDVEISEAGKGQWTGAVVTDGDNILYLGSANEGREYSVLADDGYACWFVRSPLTRTVDARGQTSGWSIASSVFNLMNAPPSIRQTKSPVPCDISTKIDLALSLTQKLHCRI